MSTLRQSPVAEASLNGIWVEWIITTLVTAGIRHVVLCPGGRSSALCVALDADSRIDVAMICTDERSGGFVALGVAKATHSPVAIVTTSGSAVANLAPVLTEADACDVPLVVVSCDRPRHLRGAGFGQMADHLGATTGFVRAQVDLDDPVDSPQAVWRARRQVEEVLRVMYGCLGEQVAPTQSTGFAQPPCHASPRRAAAGPVHLNVPFGGVYDAVEVERVSTDTVIAARAPDPVWSTPAQPHEYAIEEMVDRLCTKIRGVSGDRPLGGINGLIVVGPDPGVPLDSIFVLAVSTGFPVLADASSGLRSGATARSPAVAWDRPTGALIVNPFDILGGRDATAIPRPDLVVRFGLAPVLPALHRYLEVNATVPAIKIAASAVARDYLHPALDPRDRLLAPSASHLVRLGDALMSAAHGDASQRLPVGAAWRDWWARSACHGARTRRDCVSRLDWGEVVAAHACFTVPGYGFIHLGNSMPIRHADIGYEVRPEVQDVFVNRGVSGIDGTLSTFLGEVIARDDIGLLLVGDQALIHDLSALACAQRIGKPACVCIMNNRGGAIFDFLPIAKAHTYQRVIRNPYRIDIEGVARGFGLFYRRADSVASLREACTIARDHAGVTIVEMVVDAVSGALQLQALTQAPGRQ
jgi:2-succinyl-5-enolpyruvyl-6-hydroxy-3-cyclohexene-1-carboxylate synthase